MIKLLIILKFWQGINKAVVAALAVASGYEATANPRLAFWLGISATVAVPPHEVADESGFNRRMPIIPVPLAANQCGDADDNASMCWISDDDELVADHVVPHLIAQVNQSFSVACHVLFSCRDTDATGV